MLKVFKNQLGTQIQRQIQWQRQRHRQTHRKTLYVQYFFKSQRLKHSKYVGRYPSRVIIVTLAAPLTPRDPVWLIFWVTHNTWLVFLGRVYHRFAIFQVYTWKFYINQNKKLKRVLVTLVTYSTSAKGMVEKRDINPDYHTYGRDGEIDYALDSNHYYQPSDYDEMYDTSSIRDNSRKVSHWFTTIIHRIKGVV